MHKKDDCQSNALLCGTKWIWWSIIGLAVLLRVRQYAFNRSLWKDEAALALNILNRPFMMLAQPLDYDQGAPIGFLFAEKFIVNVLGSDEYALRLIPLTLGIASIFLFYGVSQFILDKKGAAIALILFATSELLIYYSSEVKQYSSDVFFTLTLLYIAMHANKAKQFAWPFVATWGIIGSIAIWFSHPSVFVLAASGTVYIITLVTKKDWRQLIRLSPTFSSWALSFIILYSFSLRILGNNEYLINFWKSDFAPVFPISTSTIRWYFETFFEFFTSLLKFSFPSVAILAFIVGCYSMYIQKKRILFLLLSPIAFTLLASILHKYPFRGRLLLFSIPIVLLLIAAGVSSILDQTRHSRYKLDFILLCLLLLPPFYSASSYLVHPYRNEEIRPVLDYVRKNWQDEDVLYLYYGAERAYNYYSQIGKACECQPILGISSRKDWTGYIDDLDELLGKNSGRVWVLFSHIWKYNGLNEETLFVQYLDSKAALLDSFRQVGASVYLYEVN